MPVLTENVTSATRRLNTSAVSSGRKLYEWRRAIGLNRATFARLANLSERTLATYEKLPRFSGQVRPQLNETVRLVAGLLELIPADDLPRWLEEPNPGFGGKTPWTLIARGERDLIWEMIHQTRHGAFA